MTSVPAHAAPPAAQHYCPSCERMYPSGDVCPSDGARLIKIKPVVDPLIGRVLDNRYTIREKLGQGGMGAVYRAAQHSVDREVAIKVVNAHLVSDEQAIRRFLREAKIASKLSHPNAVAVLDFGQSDDGLFYLVMELVSGRTLDTVFQAEGVLRPDRLLRIGMQVCDALESAHALQIIHRDLKPANIMLLSQGRDLVKVLDFGLAKSVDPDAHSTTMTNAGALLGTPAYMPPELALGRPCDARSDLYSLGCVLYLLGSGRLPFTYESAHELIAAHGTEPAPPMRGVPPEVAAIVARMLEKDPVARYQTAADAREALENARDGRTTPTPFGTGSSPSLAPYQSVDGRRMPATAVAPTISSAAPGARTPRTWLPFLAAFVLLGAGVGVFVGTRAKSSESAAPAADSTLAPAPAPTNPMAPTPPAGAAPATAPATPTTTPPTAAPTATGSATTPESATTTAPKASKPQKPAKPPRTATKPASTTGPQTKKPEPTAPVGAGSGSAKPSMPF